MCVESQLLDSRSDDHTMLIVRISRRQSTQSMIGDLLESLLILERTWSFSPILPPGSCTFLLQGSLPGKSWGKRVAFCHSPCLVLVASCSSERRSSRRCLFLWVSVWFIAAGESWAGGLCLWQTNRPFLPPPCLRPRPCLLQPAQRSTRDLILGRRCTQH